MRKHWLWVAVVLGGAAVTTAEAVGPHAGGGGGGSRGGGGGNMGGGGGNRGGGGASLGGGGGGGGGMSRPSSVPSISRPAPSNGGNLGGGNPGGGDRGGNPGSSNPGGNFTSGNYGSGSLGAGGAGQQRPAGSPNGGGGQSFRFGADGSVSSRPTTPNYTPRTNNTTGIQRDTPLGNTANKPLNNDQLKQFLHLPADAGPGPAQQPNAAQQVGRNRPNDPNSVRPLPNNPAGIQAGAIPAGGVQTANIRVNDRTQINSPQWNNVNTKINGAFKQNNVNVNNVTVNKQNNVKTQNRIDNRHDYGNSVRDNYNDMPHNFYNASWRAQHPELNNSYFWNGNHPANYWWRPAAWGTTVGWLGAAWAQPNYYDYGGNVTYDQNTVYVNEQPVASVADYTNQALTLANSAPPATGQATDPNAAPAAGGADSTWMPLGVYGLLTDPNQQQPTIFLQLAVNKDGVLGGTYYNNSTQQSEQVSGAVDKQTQRAAWVIGDKESVAMETGIYNLTQDETSVLVHFGTNSTQTWTLVRLPPQDTAQAGGPAADGSS